ncbi:transposase [Streptomyces sp. NPDC048434]|uniref:transposase n=1 Tax=Streptomyces sp. NPDC048434 TaxID=3365549 RepID=UPI0037222F88
MLGGVNDDGTTRSGSPIDEIVREGARRMLAAVLEAEVNQHVVELVAGLEQVPRQLRGPVAATVTRLTKQWQDAHAAFQARDLSDRDFVYVWADGVRPKVRRGQVRSCGAAQMWCWAATAATTTTNTAVSSGASA